MAKTTFVHRKIENNTFAGDEFTFTDLKTGDDVIAYFDDVLLVPTAQKRRSQLREFLSTHNIDVSAFDFLRDDEDPNLVFSVNNLSSVLSAPLSVGHNYRVIDMPWKVIFYEHSEYKGASFDLGQFPNTAIPSSFVDWDKNLTNRRGPGRNPSGSWNDCISSVKCVAYDKFWIIFKHVDFKGDHYLFNGNFGDFGKDLPAWNDETSSCAMTSQSSTVLINALRVLGVPI